MPADRPTPLSVLDLVPIASGSNAHDAIHASVELARAAEEWGYRRYWFAEHHLNPGVAGTSPAALIALAGAATSSIRLGSAAVQMGHRTALTTAEEFSLLASAFPGRVDLGLGRSGGGPPQDAAQPRTTTEVLDNGLILPPPFSFGAVARSPRFAMQKDLLLQPGAKPQPYGDQLADLLALLDGRYVHGNGQRAALPGGRSDLQVWVHGSSAGESAQAAGRLGLRFGANYHVAPASVLEAVDAYRAAFKPSADLAAPYVIVSADVVVAETAAAARELSAGYGPWVRSIRNGEGAIEFPSPSEARALPWTPEDDAMVADRVATQFVGTPDRVAERLTQLRDATGADELLVTTVTHDPADRLRSYQLLAKEWSQRGSA
ncbi:LLM class flavin-dependent oxidoreductase [Calidifontibacter sp. DB0510]|uniref:LLM class flavin-dependent oxidoreductase n=1 Tax=Metallococcus carri TaxID=1656884 RepID=A0A967B371_9MICO|nr:LLM class flavin-dependent oxidoreductase [Metallococcus carri]NHN57187.1 LLM class flavin-dependent oxidoreductase [Metallococcus carri]NOP38010.1 LLM class flavin-dependent oxidoreductase [Calidifontibacter sp. DB2511S]